MKTFILFIFSLFIVVSSNASTFAEFYCDFANGDNLNSGSTTNAAAIKTYVSAVTVNGWDSATGIFTVASGNPAQDGVTIGDWASVYVTAGATVATFVARITATNATTITVDLNAKSGTAPASDSLGSTTLKWGGAWKGPNAAVNFPFNFAAATMTNLNSGVAQGFSPRINLKNGATYAVTAAITHSLAGPCRWQGMTQWGVPGDLGRATIDCATSGAGVLMLTTSGANNDYADLIVSNSGATSGTTDGWVVSGTENTLVRCVVHDVRRDGILLSSLSSLIECEVYLANKGNTSAKAAYDVTIAGGNLIRCIAHDNAGSNVSGFLLAQNCTLLNCIADTNGKDGATISTTVSCTLIGCDFYNNVATGVDFTGASAVQMTIQNCNFIKNGTWGINTSGSAIRNGIVVNCGFGVGTQANGTGDVSASVGGINVTGSISYPTGTTPWVDPANGDFRISLPQAKGVGRGVFTETQSSYTGTVAYPDIGAAQHLMNARTAGFSR